ncbi:MAG: tryptophan--tRNA ligase [Candidatus Lambdaproteobacteria bacterium]|nr:tryptophan--tRNA ligase [Candidatus Lambdaproteobacteria bacterium]
MTKRLRTLSGITPSGKPHVGNYLGMLKPALAMQATSETFYFIADLHALTKVRDAPALRENIRELAAVFLALGIDHEHHTFFRQSDVPEVAELTWVLSCVTPMGLLQRAHAFKDAQAKEEEPNHGLFAYPVLMAADILLYDTNQVPVGKDQKQHLEITRDIAGYFNRQFGETLVLPEPRIQEEVATIPGLDGRKMSKSYNNVIPLFSTQAELRKAVMRIVTDSKGVADPKDPESCNVFQIFRHFAAAEEQATWARRYREGGMGYGEIKQATFEAIDREIGPFRERYFALRDDDARIARVLGQGGEKARAVASGVLARVRRKVGLD